MGASWPSSTRAIGTNSSASVAAVIMVDAGADLTRHPWRVRSSSMP
ncbi:MAG: hypothetical protein R2697_12045 [Ilumatobacteraceae bacterium]